MSNNPAGRKLIPVGKADPRSREEKSAAAEALWKAWHAAAGTPKAPPRGTIPVGTPKAPPRGTIRVK